MNPISGRYRGSAGTTLMMLRIDIDGFRPLQIVSGDYYTTAGGTTRFLASFQIDNLDISVTDQQQVRLAGQVRAIRSTLTFTEIEILVNPVSRVAEVQLSGAGGQALPVRCTFESPFFRTIQYEVDMEEGIQPLVSYHTDTNPSGPNKRLLTVEKVFAETGIELVKAGNSNVVPSSGSGDDQRWSNAELHAAMTQQFSLWRDEKAWKVWLFLAKYGEDEPGSNAHTLGIMFDGSGQVQRQGCAVFYRSIDENFLVGEGESPEGREFLENMFNSQLRPRQKLFTTVHELGHCFNLLHAFEKSLSIGDLQLANKPELLSFMNYPLQYVGGSDAFWNAFDFEFAESEVEHMRHGHRDDVIMGGSQFQHNAAMKSHSHVHHFPADLIENHTGLDFRIETKLKYLMGEPVVLDLRLANLRPQQPQSVHTELHPKRGLVQVFVRKPDGKVAHFHPLMEYIISPGSTTLDAQKKAIYESAYIGFDKAGFLFDRTGTYQIKAVYLGKNNESLVSNTLYVRVLHPLRKADEEVADLFLGQDQGVLLSLLGSDADSLKNGNAAFDLVLDKFGKHPLATYARLLKGMNAGRHFKQMSQDKKVHVRKPAIETHLNLLKGVADSNTQTKGLDNITLNRVMRQLAETQQALGEEKAAQATIKQLVGILQKRGLKKSLLDNIKTSLGLSLGPDPKA
jgi:hypothetical protein